MTPFTLYVPERQLDEFRHLSAVTDEPIAEIMRRVWDYGLRETVLNEIIPCMSGQLGTIKH